MGRVKLHNSGGINPIDEEDEESHDQDSPPPPSAADLSHFSCLINAEIAAVLAVMRRNARWGGRYASSSDDHLDHSLIHSLKSLRRQIFSSSSHLDPTSLLRPFLDVVRSDETGAPITGVALSSVYKIILSLDSLLDSDAMAAVVDAVTGCRFEVTDPASEEAVLVKILQVLVTCIRSRAASALTNQQVCTIVNTCFRVIHQAGTKGELLQRISRHTMHELIRAVFSRLPHVPPDPTSTPDSPTSPEDKFGWEDVADVEEVATTVIEPGSNTCILTCSPSLLIFHTMTLPELSDANSISLSSSGLQIPHLLSEDAQYGHICSLRTFLSSDSSLYFKGLLEDLNPSRSC